MAIKKGTLDELLSGREALAERVLNAELDEHLDGEATAGKANQRSPKHVRSKADCPL
jgi:putative transposase